MNDTELLVWIVDSIADDMESVTICGGFYYELDLKNGCVWLDAGHKQPSRSILSLLDTLPLTKDSETRLAVSNGDKFAYAYVTVPNGDEGVKVTQECIIAGDNVWVFSKDSGLKLCILKTHYRMRDEITFCGRDETVAYGSVLRMVNRLWIHGGAVVYGPYIFSLSDNCKKVIVTSTVNGAKVTDVRNTDLSPL